MGVDGIGIAGDGMDADDTQCIELTEIKINSKVTSRSLEAEVAGMRMAH